MSLFIRRRFVTSLQHSQRRRRQPCVVMYGGGAMGCLFASLLHQLPDKQRPIIYILSQHLDNKLIQKHGLTITLAGGVQQQYNWRPYIIQQADHILNDDIFHSNGGIVDYVMLCLKGRTSIEASIPHIKKLLANNTAGIILTLMNGIAHLDILQQYFNSDTIIEEQRRMILHGTTSQGAYFEQPNIIKQTGTTDAKTSIVLPSSLTTSSTDDDDTAASSIALAHLITMVSLAFPPITFYPPSSLETLFWSKLLVNCVINPLTALMEVNNGMIPILAETYTAWNDFIIEIISEVYAVAKAQHIVFIWEIDQLYQQDSDSNNDTKVQIEAAMSHVFSIANATAQNHSSMLSDVLNGRTTEIDSLNGEVVRLAHQYGIKVPYNEFMIQAVREKERRKRATISSS